MSNPGKITIPAQELIDKIHNYKIALWVYVDNADNAYCGLFTDAEKQAEDENPSMTGGFWEKVEFTLNELFSKELVDDLISRKEN